MAVIKVSGSRRTTQVPPEVFPSGTSRPPSRHVRVFEAIANLNRGFDQVLADVEQLKQLGLFRGEFSRQFAKTCRLTIEERRAEEDWARYGRMLLEWEKKFRDPNDVLVEAERLQKAADQNARERAE